MCSNVKFRFFLHWTLLTIMSVMRQINRFGTIWCAVIRSTQIQTGHVQCAQKIREAFNKFAFCAPRIAHNTPQVKIVAFSIGCGCVDLISARGWLQHTDYNSSTNMWISSFLPSLHILNIAFVLLLFFYQFFIWILWCMLLSAPGMCLDKNSHFMIIS